MKNVKIGYLPLYLKLYDDTESGVRPRIDAFNAKLAGLLENKGLELVKAPVCRIKSEFEAAIDTFEKENVCAIITVHLAYSPSLECIHAISRAKEPIIILDTTQTYSFNNLTAVDEIMYNHGIHGVQDMCNMLKRHGKQYFIEAGHYEKSDVIDRVVTCCKVASAAANLKNARVGIVGEPFEGMGDFRVPFEELKNTLGINVVQFDISKAREMMEAVTNQDIEDEMANDLSLFEVKDYKEDVHKRSARVNLVIRNWIKSQELTAFTINFLNITADSGLECMPFMEAGKAMSRGIGYAGEGDVLTAALSGALASIYPESSFTEMFCPDWKGNTIFLSHMGEMNVSVAAQKPLLVENDFPYTDAENPMIAYGLYKEGQAVLVNLAPDGEGKFTLIACPGEVVNFGGEDALKDSIHGWFKPRMPISQFLKEYSLAGGTHHLVIVYGDVLHEIGLLGKMMGFEVEVIR